MFKLLTEAKRQKVMHEYVWRRTIVILFGFILVFLVGVTGLLPSYVLSNVRQNEALERTRVMKSIVSGKEEPDMQDWLLEINRKLAALSPKLDVDRPSYIIGKVLAQRINGVRITNISWVKTKDGINLLASGIAQDRQTLITFENRLNASGYFSGLSLPISNLAKDKDVDFQIKFSPL